MLQNKIRTARAAAAGMVLTLVAGLAGLGVSPVLAQSASVTNVATVGAPAGTSDIDPANNTGSATVTVAPASAGYSFCTAPGGSAASNAVYSIVNGVQIWRYEAGAGGDAVVPELLLPTLAGNVNALMVDPVNDRLLFHASNGSMLWAYDADNGGWYQALSAAIPTSDLPRAGMDRNGVGYLVASGGAPAVYRVTANTSGFGYAVQNIGNLQYDFAPTNTGSGDIAFDAAGFGWLAAGQDLYRIDFSAPGNPQAIRQTRPLLGGQPSTIQWAGVAFGDDGRLYVANNSSPSNYYAYDAATGNLSQAAPTGAGGSRDLASCAFPAIAEPELSVIKTLAQVNGQTYVDGAAVAPGDVLTYAIAIANSGGAAGTLFAGDVGETVPANTTYVAANNDFACTGASCLNTGAVNVPANAEVTLNFVVRVDDPLAASATEIANAVTFPNGAIDCTAPGNDCNETTPLGPTIAVAKSADPAAGTAVAAGQTLTYTLSVTVGNAATLSDVVLTDTLGDGLTFGAVVSAGDFVAGGSGDVRTFTLPSGAAPGSYSVVYTATVDADAQTAVSNAVVPTGGGDPTDPGAPPPSCTTCTTEHPLAPAVAVTKSSDPTSGTAVAVGQTITYTLNATVTNATTQSDVVLTDTLGDGLTFGAVVDAGGFVAGGSGSVRTFTLPSGAAPGSYSVVYTATVDADASISVGNAVVPTGGGDPTDPGAPPPTCGTCATEHPLTPVVGVDKAADPASGSAVAAGQTITYTLTATVANAATQSDVVLTDTLGDGLTFGTVVSAGGFVAGGSGSVRTFTLPSGAAPGSYSVVYTATVDADASTSVGNAVVPTGGGDPTDPGAPPPTCSNCETEHPLAPAVAVAKSADPAAGTSVAAGETITYTLSVTVDNAATQSDVVLTDTLGDGLSFGAVVDAGGFVAGGSGSVRTFTLPAGAAPGSYSVVYTATVDADAQTSVANAVVPTGGGDPTDPGAPPPTCSNCETEHPLAPAVAVAKSADPASGGAVAAGQTITYTLAVTVTNAATQSDVVLTDTLGTGLSFGAIVDAGGFVAGGSGNVRTFTLPSGAAPGSYSVVYTATVDQDAQTSVGNAVVPTGGGDPTDPGAPPPTCGTCTTEHPLAPAVAVAKSADPASGAAVLAGQTITYTLAVTVGNAATQSDVVLTDTLGAGLTFGAVVDAGGFVAGGSGSVRSFTLPAGAAPGSYSVVYTATVDEDAQTSVGNAVVPTGGGDPTDPGAPPPTCANCETEHPLASAIHVAKSADPATGSEVSPNDTIAYTLTVTIANAATTEVLTLVDALGAGLTFGAVTDAGAFACSGALTCTLPVGTAPGTYPLTYTATVDADATGTVGNVVTASNPPGGNDPDPVCSTCETEHEIVATAIAVEKTSDPAAGSEVRPGDTLAYTLTVTVSNSATTEVLTLVDTLGAGLTFGTVTDAGAFACTGALSCTLPAGTLPGSYALTYTATVDADATGTVGNVVTASNPPGGNDPDPVCTSCETEHPIAATSVAVAKTSDPASGSEVSPGDTLTYTLTVTVSNSATTEVLTLVDTLGTGLTFGTVTDAGAFACTGALSCTLPAGTLPGSYALSYTATVDADATGTVGNVVTASNPPGGNDPDPVCTSCTTEHEVEATAVAVAKTSDPASGSEVSPGDTLTYTLTVTVSNSATTEVLTLVDTLGAGLTFGEVTDAGVFACNGGLTCTLPAGTLPGSYALTYTATVDADATGTVGNVVTASNPPGGNDPDPVCTSCTTEHEVVATAIVVAKTSDPVSGSEVSPGDTLTYTLTVTVSNSATTEVLTLVDTLGTGLTFGTVTDAGAFACTGALSCTLPAGTLPGSYALTYTATVDADATGTVGNVVTASNPPGGNDPDPVCTTCTTEHEVVATAIAVEKTADPASGSEVSPGDTLTYTLTVTVSNSATTEVLTLVDTMGAGLTFGAVTDAGAFACTGALSCTLPAGTLPGSYALSYTATVDADATGTVGNAVTASNPPGGNDPDPVCTTCTTEHEVVATAIVVEKTADPASGSEVSPGDTLTYTLTVTVSNSATTEVLTLVDTLGAGLTFGEVTDAGAFACSGGLTCTLPAGTLPGSYALRYTATVDAGASGTLRNAVTASNPPDGNDPDPVCTTCTTEHEVVAPVIAVAKSADPGNGAEVRAGQTIVYTLTATVSNSATLDTLTLVDTLGAGLSFGEVIDAGAFACTGALTCTLPAGALPGTYALTYTATVDADATGTVGNAVAASGGTGEGGTPPECAACSTEHPLVEPRVTIAKHATPGDGQEVRVGDAIEYTLTVTVENSATLADVRLTDTPGQGLAVGALPAGCAGDGGTVTCVLPAGAVPGAYTFVYPAVVTADAVGAVENVVLGAYVGEGGGPEPECTACQTRHEVADEALLRIVKSVGARTVAIGDLVRYTLTVENVGAVNVTDGIVVDTPPMGFSYVEGSMAVADRDGAFTLEGRHPLRIGGLDIAAGEQATIVYLLRVGAGVRQGVHVNEAVAVNAAGERVSNVATAQVALDADPMLDDSLIFGTVFDDRDGDGWQDRADLAGVRVQGGFAPGAYVAGSTTIDRGDGPQPLADASAPLLHGIDVGAIPARQSAADPAGAHRVTIRQRLRTLDFTGDFVLASAQGVTVRMAADGSTRVERDGEAAKGLNAAEPVVTRSVAAVEGGYEVAYAIANHGIDERGIPGVRIASVEGLLIETDQYGRYHLADVHGGEWRHGRNFILKVDPATLPPGAEFTTGNPLVRRITPGLPVRFDFGVRLPVQEIPGGEQRIDLELGEVIFAPDSAEVREAWLPAIERMAEQVERYGGGEVAIVADGGSEALAFARAAAVRDALQARLGPEAQAGLSVVLRTRVEDPHALVAGVDAGGALLGTVLFDTDRAEIRPEFEGLLDAVARRLEALGGGVVAVVGHTDVRGSHAYNAALGLRRATAVQQALAARLSAETREKVRVESSGDPAVPVGTERE